jgi:hypothetical protein
MMPATARPRCCGCSAPEEVAQRQQVHPVQRPREHQAEQHQADRRAERVRDQAAKTLVDEGGRDAEDGFGAEPGREHHRQHDHEGQIAAGDDVVARIVHPCGGIQADADRHDDVGNHEPQEHEQIFRLRSLNGRGDKTGTMQTAAV